MITAIRWSSSILSYEEKETHAFWDRHQFPIFTSKRHRFLKYLKFNGAIDEYFLTEYVIYRGFNCCALNPLNFPVNRFGKQLHRKSKFKWISRNYWKEEYWVSEKGICERELRENKIQKNSYRFWIEKIVISKIRNFWESEFSKEEQFG